MIRTLLVTIAVLSGSALAMTIAPPARTPFSITIHADSTTNAKAGDAKPQSRSASRSLDPGAPYEYKVSVQGREVLGCKKEDAPKGTPATSAASGPTGSTGDEGERKSLAEASTNARATTTRDGSVEFVMGIRTLAQGGHVRACATCRDGKCIGGMTLDSAADANARIQVSIDITFLADLPAAPYLLVVKHALVANGVDRYVSLVQKDGRLQAISSGEEVPIAGGAGQRYRILARLESGSTETGAFEDETRGTLTARLTLAPAPQVSVRAQPANIPSSSSDVPSVGLLITRGKRGEPVPTCTGTVVGPRSIITAAHCLEIYSTNSELYFVPGQSLKDGLARSVRIADWARPTDEFQGGFRYRVEKGRSIDDIALLFTEDPIDIAPAELPRSIETPGGLVALASFAELVTYISGGQGETKFAGEDARKIASRAYFTSVGKRTATLVTRDGTLCAGWSGAPVTAISNGRLVIIGLALSGERDCTRAEALRLDAYWPWLAARIR